MADCTYPKCQQTAIPGCQGLCRDLSVNHRATDGQRAGVPEGYRLVPVEPTIAMVEAGENARKSEARPWAAHAMYAAMLAAAPTPPAGDAGQERSANPYGEGYEDGLAHAAFYVRDHCAEGEYHADVIEKLKRPARAGDAGQERDWRDAERYLHVRAHGMPKLCPAGFYYHDGVFYPTADAAIDAYMAASKGEKA